MGQIEAVGAVSKSPGEQAQAFEGGSWGPALVGLRGSGKSALAPRVAARLGLDWLDADAELERREGRRVAEIFAQEGPAGFRRRERSLLIEDLLQRERLVLATGGGAVLDAEVRACLARRVTIWLDAPLAVLAERIAGSERPSLTGQPIVEELETLRAQREPLYRAVASLVLDTASADPDTLAERIAEHWRATRRTGRPLVLG